MTIKPKILNGFFLVVSLILTACDLANTPDVLPTTRLEWRQLLKWDNTCDTEQLNKFLAGSQITGVYVHKLSDSSLLVEVICQVASYNQGEIIYHVKNSGSEKNIKLLKFKQIRYIEPETGADEENPDYFDPNIKSTGNSVDHFFIFSHQFLWGSLSIDPVKQTIINTDLFSGAGGCGLYTKYKLQNDKPEIIAFRAEPHCTTKIQSPDEWKLYSKADISQWPVQTAPKGWGDPDSED